MDRGKLYTGISKAAWGYFFIYFDININSVSLLPDFVGYLLFLSAIKMLEKEERDLALLHTLGIILVLWHGLAWILSWGGETLDGAWQFMDVIIGVVNLYFHFQLLTNFASIAGKYQPEGYALDEKLLRYRTLQTVMLTTVLVITNLALFLTEVWAIVSVVMLVVYLIAGICLMKALFDLRKCFEQPSTLF